MAEFDQDTESVPRLERLSLLAALPITALSATVLSACAERTEPIPVTTVVEHYRQVTDELFAAMDGVRELGWQADTVTTLQPANPCQTGPGQCSPSYWLGEEGFEQTGPDGIDWNPWRPVIDPVLENQGFKKLGRQRRQGAAYIVSSIDIHGAKLRLYNQSGLARLEILGAQTIGDGCD